MTVLVTGSSGLVGGHVIEALRARGEPVRALVRPPSRRAVEDLGAEAVLGDVTDPAAWRAAVSGVRGIVHAAALVVKRVTLKEYLAVNVEGTRLAIEAARAAGARLVHLSSVAVYGGIGAYQPRTAPRTEDFPFGSIPEDDFYARTKRMAEQLVREEAERGGLAAVAIRPNVIYGERDRLFTPRLVPIARRGIAPVMGRGTNRLSCVYAGNVAAAVVAALDARTAGFHAYHATHDAPPELTQREFFTGLAEALSGRSRRLPLPVAPVQLGLAIHGAWHRLRDPQRYAGPGHGAIAFMTGDNPYADDRARVELGYRPPFTTREAIARTARWFLENETPGR